MPFRKQNKVYTYNEIADLFSTGIKEAVNRPTINNYVPHEKQIQFHSSDARHRLYIGGNRAGKTVGGAVEDIWWLLGRHPYRKTPPPPVKGRIVTVDFTDGFEQIIRPEIIKWLPPSSLINGSWEDSFKKQERILTLANGSTVEFMSYEQDVDKFAGTSRHFVHFDEEPPKAIFRECRMRLIDTKGSWWITMTPLDGMDSFIYDEVYERGLNDAKSNIEVIQVDISENPYIDPEEIKEVFDGITDEAEVAARKEGRFVQIGGLVFKSFRPDIHVIEPFIPPIEWPLFVSMDHGFNNPSAWLYHSVSPKGVVFTWDELYDNEVTIPEWAAIIKERNAQEGRRTPDIYVADPAIKQRSAIKGTSVQTEYAVQGIPFILGTNDVSVGVNKMNNYLRSAKWFITENCIYLRKQLRRVRWKTYETQKLRDRNNPTEQIHKLNDHTTDSARYFYSTQPEIPRLELGPKLKSVAKEVVESIINPVTPAFVGNSIDCILRQSSETQETDWTVVDEHVGGYY